MFDDREKNALCVPVPVRAAAYASLLPEHRELGVEVDLAAIAPFAIQQHPPESLLFADMQTPAWGGPNLRLGSGRSGFYRGHYLKGVGRTQLAANWSMSSDWYHGTGHQFPTSAVRELLATEYLQSRGLGESIVPCTGLLLKPIEPRLREDLQRALGPSFARLAPIDRELQAISIKPAGFLRLSNLLWALTRAYGRAREWELLSLWMERYARNEQVAPSACSPETIAAALSQAATRAIASFIRYFAVGVGFQSIWNNMTLDGRFLDLEVPFFACRPFFGGVEPFDLTAHGRDDDPPSLLAGTEGIEAAFELRVGLTQLAQRVRSLHELPIQFHPLERAFMRELATQIGAVANDERVFGQEAVLGPIAAQLAAQPHAPADLARILAACWDQRQQAYFQPKLEDVVLERTPLTLHRIEPLVSEALWLPPGAYRASDWDDAELINGCIRTVEQQADVDRALVAIAEARTAVRARFATR